MNKIKFGTLAMLSMTMVMMTLPFELAQAQPPYFQAITNLNPVGYWPMHDLEAPAAGDIETNYGSAGPLANGYYADWVDPTEVHQFTPPQGPAIVGDSNPCLYFNAVFASSSGNKVAPTNYMIVPRTSPAATLNVPFTVECWYLPTNNSGINRQCDIWASVNAGGSEAGLNGAATYSGIRLFENGTYTLYSYANSGGQNDVNAAGTTTLGVWTHLVVTVDANTNMTLYQNGVSILTYTAPYAPNTYDPFEIDTGKGFTRSADGCIDEFAIYTNALSALDISNHYATGINPAPAVPYHTLVLNDNPSIYYRMDSPTYAKSANTTGWPAVANYGSVAVNGVYTPGTVPAGAPGPNNGSAFALGFGTGTNAMPGSGMSSFADVGYAAAYNPAGSNAFSVSAWFQGPCDSRLQTIAGHSDGSWRIAMNINGTLQAAMGTSVLGNTNNSVGVYNDGNWHQVMWVYSPASVPSITGTNSLYVDGVLDSSISTVNTNGFGAGSTMHVMIGTDPQYTNNAPNTATTALGRQFSGNICEVALFTNAMTASQVKNLYNAAEMPPYFTTQPVPATANQGTAFTNTVVARGGLPLAYQWFTNGVALASQTNASLVINPVQSSSAGNYYVVVTNNSGSVTSTVVSLTVNSSPSLMAQYPVTYTNLFTLYAGANPTFSVVAGGAQPISYFWTTNGALDGAATNASVVLSNVQVGNISAKCIASNFLGSVTSMVWSASVIVDPDNPAFGGLAPYPQAVLALNPIGYWRMNEPDDGVNDGNSNAVCHDYAGGNDALYTNVNLGNFSYSALDLDDETSVQVGTFASTFSLASWVGPNVDFSTPAGGNGEFSVETWVSLTKNSSTTQPQGGGIVCKGPPNSGEEFVLDTSSGGPFRFSVRNAAGTQYTAAAAAAPVLNTFHHVVGVCDEVHGTVSLYINGALAGQTSIPAASGIVSGNSIPMTMGARTPGAAAISSQSFGYLNDVAVFNYALSSNQVAGEYLQSGIAPYFTQVPTNSVNIASGSNLVVSAAAVGTTPLGFQWYDTNNVGIPGQTNAVLVLNNVTVNDTYYLTVTNLYGSITSPFVTVGVYTGPFFSSYLPVTYTNLFTLYTGSSPAFSVQAVNLQHGQPVFYQWYGNGAGISGATSTNFALSSVPLGSINNYYCVASNLLGATTSFVWSASVVAPPTNPYPQAVLSLHPSGYWRLDEPDDGLGDNNAGNVAHDYIGGNDGTYTNMILAAGSSYDPVYDPTFMSAEFGFAAAMNSDASGIMGIDFSATNAGKAFSVEAWVNGFTQSKDSGIVSKGYGSGGEQFDLDTGSDGGTPSHAFRFLVRSASGASYSVNSSIQPASVWHHLVGVCDEPHGALTLYIDGQPAGTTAIPTTGGILASTSPMSIGSRYSTLAAQGTNTYDDQFVGYINDVAVFNYALTATQVTNEFQGIPAPSVNQNPTNIVASVSGNQLTLAWPADHTGWQLQVQTNSLSIGLGTNWVQVSGSTSVNQVVVPMNPTNGSVFYRLVYPPLP